MSMTIEQKVVTLCTVRPMNANELSSLLGITPPQVRKIANDAMDQKKLIRWVKDTGCPGRQPYVYSANLTEAEKKKAEQVSDNLPVVNGPKVTMVVKPIERIDFRKMNLKHQLKTAGMLCDTLQVQPKEVPEKVKEVTQKAGSAVSEDIPVFDGLDGFVDRLAIAIANQVKLKVMKNLEVLGDEFATTFSTKVLQTASEKLTEGLNQLQSKIQPAEPKVASEPVTTQLAPVALVAADPEVIEEPEVLVQKTRFIRPVPLKVGVIGLLPIQNNDLEKELNHIPVKLSFWKEGKMDALATIGKNCDAVFVHVDHVAHSTIAKLKKAGAKLNLINGGKTAIKIAVERYYIANNR